jgi:hypothetical protein
LEAPILEKLSGKEVLGAGEDEEEDYGRTKV